MSLLPYDDRDGFIWIDGEMLPWREAKVHFLTHGLHYATQVFEGERAYNNKIFKSMQHSERLERSANIIHLDLSIDFDTLEGIKYDVLKANNLENAYIRAAVWRGPEEMGIGFSDSKSHIAVAAWDWGSYFDPEIRERGISIGTSRWAKPAPHTAPTESKCAALYALSTMAKNEANKAGHDDALMLDYEGLIAEATAANFFAVIDGALHTPIADRFLNGITRQTVIKIAKDLGINIIERRIKPDEINTFEEAFLTGTAAEITPIGRIDDHSYSVGPVTKKLYAAYEDLVNGRP